MTNGRNGANSRSSIDSASAQRRAAPTPAALVAALAVGALLDQLDVVVAEPPEERLGALERPGVVVVVERRGRLVDDVGELGEQRPVERLGDRGDVAGGSRRSPSTNFDALSSLMASRRPIFIWPASNAVSVPGRALAAQ